MAFGIGVQAPFWALLLTQVSMKAMPIQPSSTLAYLEPSHLKALPAFHLRTSASKQRCRRANASWKASGWPAGTVGSAMRSAGTTDPESGGEGKRGDVGGWPRI